MNSSDYGVVSRGMPDKMNESMSVPPLVCRDVKATKRRFNAVNGSTYASAGTEVRIPIAANAVLGAYNTNLNLELTVTGATDPFLADVSWFALFSQIRIESGAGSSIILEQVDEPGVVASFVMQYTYTQEDQARANGMGLSIQAAPTVATGKLDKYGTSTAIGDIAYITLDLSTVLGLFTSSLPLYETSGITVVLTLNQFAASGIFTNNITALSMKNVYITASCLEGGEKYEKDLRDAKTKNGEVSVMFNTVRRYVQSQASTGAQNAQYLINDRAKSCLGFFGICRTTSELLTGTVYKNSSSSFAGWKNHNYNIAGQMYPMSGVATIGEAIDESFDTMKHLSRRKESTVTGGLINRTQTDPSLTYASTSAGTSGIVCVNLSKCGAEENVWGKGLNLSGSNLTNFLNIQYTPAAVSTINIYSIFQMKVHIDKMGGFSTEF
jgi:hypothetical protein